ncbi:MAG: glycerophosphodiester phosphodiesterase [Chloroflexi bacterium]|nr:MAG: glycerophosphodiester phosphodiesterase [Chloroflexota bacterium]
MDSTPPLIIAHRGARSLAPENTLAAAQKAYDLGADLWELDVAVSADNELVLMHDDSLERTCNAKAIFPDRSPWNVWDFTLAEIQSLDCGSWYNQKDPFEQIKAGNLTAEERESFKGIQAPTLRQALEFTRDNQWRVNVELKDQPDETQSKIIVDKTVEMVTELGMDKDQQVVISSFNHEYLKKIKELNSNIPVQAITQKLIGNIDSYLKEYETDTVNPKINTWSYKRMTELEAQGIHFNVWTVNDEITMKALIKAGTSGIITDYPQTLVGLLEKP